VSDFATAADADYVFKLLLKYAANAGSEEEKKVKKTTISDKKYKLTF